MTLYRVWQWWGSVREWIRVLPAALIIGGVLYPLLLHWLAAGTAVDCASQPQGPWCLGLDDAGFAFSFFPFAILVIGGIISVLVLKFLQIHRWFTIGIFSNIVVLASYALLLSYNYPHNPVADAGVLLISTTITVVGASIVVTLPRASVLQKRVALIGVAILTLLSALLVSYAILYVQSAPFRAAIDSLPQWTAYEPAYLPTGYSADYPPESHLALFKSPASATYPWSVKSYRSYDGAISSRMPSEIWISSSPKTPNFNPPRSCGSAIHERPPAGNTPCHFIGRTVTGSPVYLLEPAIARSNSDLVAAYTLVGTTVIEFEEVDEYGSLIFDNRTILRILSSLRPSHSLEAHHS